MVFMPKNRNTIKAREVLKSKLNILVTIDDDVLSFVFAADLDPWYFNF